MTELAKNLDGMGKKKKEEERSKNNRKERKNERRSRRRINLMVKLEFSDLLISVKSWPQKNSTLICQGAKSESAVVLIQQQ